MSEEALQSIAQQYLSLADLLTDSTIRACLFDDEAYEGQGILLYVSKMATTMHCTKTTFLEFFHSVTKETKFCNKA